MIYWHLVMVTQDPCIIRLQNTLMMIYLYFLRTSILAKIPVYIYDTHRSVLVVPGWIEKKDTHYSCYPGIASYPNVEGFVTVGSGREFRG